MSEQLTIADREAEPGEVESVCLDLRGADLACDALAWLVEQPAGTAYSAPHEYAATLRHSRALRRCVRAGSQPHPRMRGQRQGIYQITKVGEAVVERLGEVAGYVRASGIYFIQGETTRLIKIGYACSIGARLTLLQCGSPDVLSLLWHYEAPRSYETALHHAFAEARAHGEWFRPTPALLAYIEERAPALLRERSTA